MKYKLFINGFHVGNFSSIRSLMEMGLSGQRIVSIKWRGANECHVKTA